MRVMEFIMRLKKTTKCKACFKENMDRIGRIYLPIPLFKKLDINDELLVQLAPDKSIFPQGGYMAKFVYEKETAKKIRFIEYITEKGDLGIIYVSKNILANMGVQDEIAVRVVPPGETGGDALAR